MYRRCDRGAGDRLRESDRSILGHDLAAGCIALVIKRRDHDDAQLRVYRFRLPDEYEAVAGGHSDVCHQHVDVRGAESITLLSDVPDVPLPITLDRGKMIQVFNNLISNAIKFSREGTTVRVGARQILGGIEAWVTDQGQGMQQAELPQLFHKFSRTSVRATRGEKSTGLGLYIVAEVLRLHHGTIRVDTEPGRGSTFTCTLPV